MTFSHRGEWIVRADRRGRDGWVGALVLPTRFGQIVLSAEVPDGAVRRFRGVLCEVHRELHRECPPSVGDVYDYVGEELAACLPSVGDEVGIPLLGALMPGLMREGGRLLGGLFGGTPAPATRTGGPEGGTAENRARILAALPTPATRIRSGEDTRRVRAVLEQALTRQWDPRDLADVRAMLAELPTSGPVDLARLAAGAGSGLAAPQRGDLQASPTPSFGPLSLPGLASALGGGAGALAALGGGNVPGLPPEVLASLLGSAGTLAQAQAVAAPPSAAALFGDLRAPIAGLVRTALRSVDATAARDLGDPSAREALQRARESTEARVANALRMVDSMLGV